jgi:hypothetical protein
VAEDILQRKTRCPYAEICPFFEALQIPASAEVLKTRYCLDHHEKCERYELKSTGREVPEAMWPDGTVQEWEPASP